jgi:hypothetical protein
MMIILLLVIFMIGLQMNHKSILVKCAGMHHYKKQISSMKKRIILCVICLLGWELNAQIDVNKIDSLKNDVEQQIKNIDSQILFKTLLDYDGYRIGEETSINEWLTVLYFDSSGILKKSKLMYFYPEDAGCYLRYYGKNGVVIYSAYESYSGMNSGYSVSRYLDESGELLYIDFLNRDDDRGGQVIEHIIRTGGYNLPVPLINGEVYDKVLNMDSLKNEIKQMFGIDSLFMPEQCMPIKFFKPEKGDTIFITDPGLMFYEDTSFNSNTGSRFNEFSISNNAGNRFEFKEVIITETKGDWYKVKFQDRDIGYVYSKYLLLVAEKYDF